MEIPHYKNGTAGRTEVDPSFLGDKVKVKTLRQAILIHQNNKRVGTHDTKTRAEIARSKRALFKQKGLGRGRVKHPQVAQCRGGGVAHGPHPRDYSTAMPKKARRVAIKSALLSKFRDGQVVLADNSAVAMSVPKTSALAGMLKNVGAADSCLILSENLDRNLILAARNMRRVKVMKAREVNAFDLLFYRHLLVTEGALNALKETFGDG